MVGLLQAATCLQHNSVAPLLHLCTLNPYVAATLEAANPGAWALPRQHTALPAPPPTSSAPAATQPRCCGVSAFAFQGTNAHVLMSQHVAAVGWSPPPGVSPVTWQHEHFWPLPVSHMMLTRAALVMSPGVSRRLNQAARGDVAVMEVQLGGEPDGPLAYLWDHQVGYGPARSG